MPPRWEWTALRLGYFWKTPLKMRLITAIDVSSV